MTKHTLFICRTCSASLTHDDVKNGAIAEGVLLLQQLQELQQNKSVGTELNELTVEAVGCLWTCNRSCSITFACPGKYTYHFVDLHHIDSITALQQFSELYLNSADGYVKPPKMPEKLRSHLLVRVPPLPKS